MRGRLGWRRCLGIDGDDHLAVAAEHPGEGFADQRDVALADPVAGEHGWHAHGERVPVGIDEHGIGKPGLISGADHLEAELFLGDLPELLWVHARGRVPTLQDRLNARRLITDDSDTDCSIHSFLALACRSQRSYPQLVHISG
jgi:hypothetical protein